MTTALVRVQALRRYGQRSYVTAETSCTEIDQQIPVATASNVNCGADVANHVTWLWQAFDLENFERRNTG